MSKDKEEVPVEKALAFLNDTDSVAQLTAAHFELLERYLYRQTQWPFVVKFWKIASPKSWKDTRSYP